ncbi:thymidylate kinase [Gordonia araii NBRC 100433]|uniref:Thymidylate kinase n=1 Tax=Gordonia araii NBRC 100433 TaxID=1073574 RepID=G7H287_9ACTN|nr:thymidylate kinase [Gordonia araii NBRC 100433]
MSWIVSTFITVEGLDGAGKRTLVDGLRRQWEADSVRVTTIAFPRYGESVHADLAAEALRGEHGDVTDSAYAMALLFALDRREAAPALRELIAGHDVVIADRYVASNAAYTSARLAEESVSGAVAATEWVRTLEFERFGLPVPDWQLFLGVPVEVAAQRAVSRAEHDASRDRDRYERDAALQERVDEAYRGLAAAQWVSPWRVLSGDPEPGLAADLLA